MIPIERAAQLLDDDLTHLFTELWDIDHGQPLREHPGLTEQLVEALHTHAARIHSYVAHDSYPIVVTVSETYLLWVGGESQNDAVTRFQNDGSWYERIDRTEATGGWHEARADETWDRSDVYPEEIGPPNACRTCLKDPGWGANWGYTPHTDSCPIAIERRAQREAEQAAREAVCEALRCRICQQRPLHPDRPVWHKMDCPNRGKDQ